MKKIMFNNEFMLTQAVINGRKTQTRRIVPQKELDKINLFQEEYYDATFDKLEGVELLAHYFFTEKRGKLPYSVGEVVAVAQSYKDIFSAFSQNPNPQLNIGVKNPTDTAGWNNKMFVKAELMPHQIRITDVRVERLQDISDTDCVKEGVQKMLTGCEYYQYSFYDNHKCLWNNYKTPREAFAHLINKVSRKDVWQETPYVFVYDFELVK